jgi:hypothetical protein
MTRTFRHVIGPSKFGDGVENDYRGGFLEPFLARALAKLFEDLRQRFLGLAHLAKPRHVLANRSGLPIDICQCQRSLFSTKHLRLERAIPSDDGSADFLALIRQPSATA